MSNNVKPDTSDAQQKSDYLNQMEAQVQAAWEAEQATGISDPAEQAARIEQIQQSLNTINQQLDLTKGQINQYRREIKAEQQCYERLPLAQRINLLPQLETATKQRLEKIAELETEITRLHTDQWQTTTKLELAKQRLEVLKYGFNPLP
jgi:hypothetical protein